MGIQLKLPQMYSISMKLPVTPFTAAFCFKLTKATRTVPEQTIKFTSRADANFRDLKQKHPRRIEAEQRDPGNEVDFAVAW